MSELSFEGQVAEATHPDQHADNGTGTLALSADEFSALEERILRAVNLVKREKLARTAAEERASAAEERASAAESKLAEQTDSAGQLNREIESLRAEREAVRQRVEKLVTQLDALEA
jgi:uncharacterized protein YaiL (DUF2058 family)